MGKVNWKSNRSIFEVEIYRIVDMKITNIEKVERGFPKTVFSSFVIILLHRKLAKRAPTKAHMPFPNDNASGGIGLKAKYRITTPPMKIGKIQNHAFRGI